MTTLRLIGGLAQPESRRIPMAGRDSTAVPSAKRNPGMVFQKYLLLPHLAIGDRAAVTWDPASARTLDA